MPLYEYQCDGCGHRFELIQRFSDPPADACPKCGGVVRKLLSSPAIQFKGSGWYITDYARKGGGEGASADAKSDAAKGDAKPAGDAKAGDTPAAPKSGDAKAGGPPASGSSSSD
jgi:putative FmdB family regulatory protein